MRPNNPPTVPRTVPPEVLGLIHRAKKISENRLPRVIPSPRGWAGTPQPQCQVQESSTLDNSAYLNYPPEWSIIPIRPKSKKPCIQWEEFQFKRADLEQRKAWANQFSDCGWALVCGSVSKVIVLDVDGPSGWAFLKDNQFAIPPTRRACTSPEKAHFYFKYSGLKIRTLNLRKKFGADIEIRGEGAYVVLPPSRHPAGHSYMWESEAEIADPPSWLLNLAKAGTSEATNRVCIASENLLPPEVDVSNGNFAAYARAALDAELEKLVGTSEGERIDQLNRSAFLLGQLIGAGILDRALVEGTLQGMALSIGLDEVETRATIRSGLESGIRQPRRLPERELLLGQKKQEQPQEPLRPLAIPTITARDLASKNFPPRRWEIPDLITEGLTILAGPPKTGKSWLLLDMAAARAAGGVTLGKIQVDQGEVLYLALEDSERRLKDRLEKILPSGKFPKTLYFATSGAFPQLHKGGQEALDAWLKQHPNVKFVIIDTLGRVKPARGRNQDSYEHDTAVMATLQALSFTHQAAIVVVHHTKKAKNDDFVTEVSGTYGITRAADCIAVLSRKGRGEMDGTLKLTGRDIEERELALKFDPDAGQWGLLGDAYEFRMSQERQEILTLLKEEGPQTPAQLAKKLSKNPGAVRKLLWKMKGDFDVNVLSNGKYIA